MEEHSQGMKGVLETGVTAVVLHAKQDEEKQQ
jgi:hypothetical protein